MELLAALRAADGSQSSPPVPGDAGFAEMVHAGEHDGLPEQITADGTRQVLPQAAFGGGGWSSGSHDGMDLLSQISPDGEVKVEAPFLFF